MYQMSFWTAISNSLSSEWENRGGTGVGLCVKWFFLKGFLYIYYNII